MSWAWKLFVGFLQLSTEQCKVLGHFTVGGCFPNSRFCMYMGSCECKGVEGECRGASEKMDGLKVEDGWIKNWPVGCGTIKLALKRISIKYVVARESTVQKVPELNQIHTDKYCSFVIN